MTIQRRRSRSSFISAHAERAAERAVEQLGPGLALERLLVEGVVEVEEALAPVAGGDVEGRRGAVRVGGRLPCAVEAGDRVGPREPGERERAARAAAAQRLVADQLRGVGDAPVARDVERDPLHEPARRAPGRLPRERRVRELVRDDAAAAVRVERPEPRPHDEQPLRGDPHDLLRRPLLAHAGVRDRRQRGDALDAGGHRARLGGVARDDHQVAAPQPARDEDLAHPRVAVLERFGEPVGREPGGREDDEVPRCAAWRSAPTSHGWRGAGAPAGADPPAARGPHGAQRPLGVEAPADPGDGVARAHLEPRPPAVDADVARGQADLRAAAGRGRCGRRGGPRPAARRWRWRRSGGRRRAGARGRGGRAAP